jgi:hypothetical protein
MRYRAGPGIYGQSAVRTRLYVGACALARKPNWWKAGLLLRAGFRTLFRWSPSPRKFVEMSNSVQMAGEDYTILHADL